MKKTIEQAKMLATVLGQDGVYLKGTIFKREAIPAEIIQEIEAGTRTVEVTYGTTQSSPSPSPVMETSITETPEELDTEVSGRDTNDDAPAPIGGKPVKKKAIPKKVVGNPSLRRTGK